MKDSSVIQAEANLRSQAGIQFFRAMLKILASLELFFVLSFLLMGGMVLGTALPRSDVYSSSWFVGLMTLLGLSLAATITVRVMETDCDKLPWGALLSHLGFLVILLGGSISGLSSEKGILPLKVGNSQNKMQSLRGDNGNISLPFEVGLKDFKVEFYENGGRVRQFRSSIEIRELKSNAGDPAPKVLAEGVISVNRPFHFGGYGFYQTGYDPENLNVSTLQVVKDRGVPLVYSGFILLPLGLAASFYGKDNKSSSGCRDCVKEAA